MLPANFLFSQTSLSDWRQCKRRFQYLYLQHLSYPAPETKDQIDFEQHMERGDDFHRLVHQHLVDIAPERIVNRIEDEQVREWWDSYLAHGLTGIPENRHAEVILTAPIGDYRLIAKYDLIAVEAGKRAIIVDWKTSEHRPQRRTLKNRMQTAVYRYLLVEAGWYYNGNQPVIPEQVEMIYWFANFPTQPEVFTYDAAQHQADKILLENMVAEIAAETDFPKVPESAKDQVCRFCNYRSLCWENVNAGAFAEMVEDEADIDDFDLDIDLDQIAEIEF